MTFTLTKQDLTLAEFIAKPPENKEWVDSNLVEKMGMTIRHSKVIVKSNLSFLDCGETTYRSRI